MGNCVKKFDLSYDIQKMPLPSMESDVKNDNNSGNVRAVSGQYQEFLPLDDNSKNLSTKNQCNETKIQLSTVAVMVGIFDYNARTKEELSIRKGEKVIVINSDTDQEWLFVEKMKKNASGYIPSQYVAFQGSVEAQEWFVKNFTRKDSERLLLLSGNPIGTFLIRKCESVKDSYSLSVRDGSSTESVKHYRINYKGNLYWITSVHKFPTLEQLVVFYSDRPHGLCQLLTLPCPRPLPVTKDLSFKTWDQWEVERSSIALIERLGAGQFGEVYKGMWNGTALVAVKTLKPGSMSKEDFLKESRIMKTLNHPKLVKLYAICSDDPMYIITELMSHGSLLEYLRNGPGNKCDLESLIHMMSQIANGMAYLENKHYIHRDLAARNILVGENNVCKVADFGLALMMRGADESYMAQQGDRFPIKWTAPEAAINGIFTIKSDVWSFGIVLYEIVTVGGAPYPSMDNVETLIQVQKGYRMSRPPRCPSGIFSLMLTTWHTNPDNRPTFQFLCQYFEDFSCTDSDI